MGEAAPRPYFCASDLPHYEMIESSIKSRRISGGITEQVLVC
jgi:hypothetical protein